MRAGIKNITTHLRIGIADTTFARVDMASIVIAVLKKTGKTIEIERYTVPGMKDLAVAAKKLIEEHNCSIVLALGWVGKEDIDETCAHEANIGLINAELATNTHILKIFIHEREAKNEKDLFSIAKNRVEKHTLNALALLKGKETLAKSAGQGKRQGRANVGKISVGGIKN